MKTRWYWAFVGILLIISFFALSSEIREAADGEIESITSIDQRINTYFVEVRTPPLTILAMDITALGSVAVLTLVVIMLLVFFLCFKRSTDALILLVASLGVASLTRLLKIYYLIPRPDELHRLVTVNGYSYPSGHTLASCGIYLTIALIVARRLARPIYKFFIIFSFTLVILLVGLTRMYLGVHNFTDVLAGILVGTSLALLINGFEWFFRKSETQNVL